MCKGGSRGAGGGLCSAVAKRQNTLYLSVKATAYRFSLCGRTQSLRHVPCHLPLHKGGSYEAPPKRHGVAAYEPPSGGEPRVVRHGGIGFRIVLLTEGSPSGRAPAERVRGRKAARNPVLQKRREQDGALLYGRGIHHRRGGAVRCPRQGNV